MASRNLMTSGVASSWTLCIVSLLLVRITTQQNEIYFRQQLPSYIYSLPNTITVILCEAVRVSNAGEDIPIAATPYLNGERLATGSLPLRHQLVVRERVVAGVVIVPTTHEDAGSRYRCMVEGEEGEVVAITRQTRIIVGDGLPLRVKGVEQLNQMLYSVVLGWNEPPVPENSPIQGYEITVIPEDQGSAAFTVDVSQNTTSFEVSSLQPASSYLVSIAGVNSHGVGNASQYLTVMTSAPLVPEPPRNVTATAIIGSTSASLIVTWKPPLIDYEVMTPISSYIIYYGREASLDAPSVVVEADEAGLSEYTVPGITSGGHLLVGVASVNSAGASTVVYSQGTVGVGCGVLSAPDHGLAHQTGIAVGSSGNYSCQQGFTLSENETRVCLDSGDWTGGKPTCIKLPATDEVGTTLSSEMTIIISSVAVVLGLILTIAVVIVLIIILRQKYARMDKRHAIATFGNASPPLKRHKKSHGSNKAHPPSPSNEYSETPDPRSALAMLSYAVEPRTAGTPPPPETTTFPQGTPSPPLPPSYSDLEVTNSSGNDARRGFTNQLVHSNCSPPEHSSQSIGSDGVTESCSRTDSPLSEQNTTVTECASHSSHGSSDNRTRGAAPSHNSGGIAS